MPFLWKPGLAIKSIAQSPPPNHCVFKASFLSRVMELVTWAMDFKAKSGSNPPPKIRKYPVIRMITKSYSIDRLSQSIQAFPPNPSFHSDPSNKLSDFNISFTSPLLQQQPLPLVYLSSLPSITPSVPLWRLMSALWR